MAKKATVRAKKSNVGAKKATVGAKKTTVGAKKAAVEAKKATVGIMHSGSEETGQKEITMLTAQLYEKYQQPLTIDGPHYSRSRQGLLDTAKRLIDANVGILIVAGGSRSAEAALRARGTAKTPIIIFTSVAPYVLYEIDDFSITTGMDAHTSDHDGIRLELLLVMLQRNNPTIGVLRNSNRGDHSYQWYQIQQAAQGKCTLVDADVNSDLTIEGAFDLFASKGVNALLVTADHFFYGNRDEIVRRANTANYPAIYQWRDFVELGGLMSYGPNLDKLYALVGAMVADILTTNTVPPIHDVKHGEFELVVNQASALQFGMLPLFKSLPVPRSMAEHHPVFL